MPLFITIVAVFALILLISVCKMNAFIALTLISIGSALAFGIAPDTVIHLVETGMGGTLGHIALIFGLGAMLGKLVAEAGGAQSIAHTLIEKFGEAKIEWAVMIASFIVGIAMFFEVGLVLLAPIVLTVAREMRVSPMKLGLPMLAALLATHCFLPPHPGPTVIAAEYGARLGQVLLYGTIIALPIIILCGPIFNFWARHFVPSAFAKISQEDSKNKFHHLSPKRLPGFGISLLTSMLPVLLMMLATIVIELHLATVENSFWEVIVFLGKPPIAMLLSVLFAMWSMGLKRGIRISEIMASCSSSIAAIGMMLLIIGGGGAFKQTLLEGGVGTYIQNLFIGVSISPIVLAWTVAAALRISLGSATVAALSTAGLVLPMLGSDANLAFVTLATGAGSSIASHVNDAGFWMVKEYFGLTLKETFATWTLMSTCLSILGLLAILLLKSLL